MMVPTKRHFYPYNGVIYISQYDYGDEILARFGRENRKAVATPVDEKQALIERPTSDGTASKAEIKEFQTKLGTLIWLMVSTRPDIPTKRSQKMPPRRMILQGFTPLEVDSCFRHKFED
ncbi:hypothetical protein N7516_011299 [Penicillium verrucosum]|uniref:uncharacterized protein n=1 Tax=Penicillium verrucosum TaxID=60171 RepID=UPI0025456754|nr:uncharacterized protein N7516_011299 [Penicillium verrucosum]KAJ5920441.1 hypothetical protein N7516_011299 [Penicillium verrucosum]